MYSNEQPSRKRRKTSLAGRKRIAAAQRARWAKFEAGERAVSGEPYGHTQKTHCDSWQVNLPVAVCDGITVTGIQQESVRAKVDTRLCRKLTPLGVALKNLNPSDSQQIRWGIGLGFFDSYHFVKPDEYCEYDSVMFNNYDDGRAQSL